MRLRTRHLACLILLISSIGAAQASVSAGPAAFYGNHIAALLYRQAVDRGERAGETASAMGAADARARELRGSGRGELRRAWTMRPASVQCAAVYAATSFRRARAA